MQWGYFLAWAASIFFLFFITGWPVSPGFQESWGNHYKAKNLTYYAVLYLHDLLGPLFFSFLFLGLVRNFIWKEEKGGNRQIAFLLSYSVLVAAAIAVVLVHRYSPIEGGRTEEVAATAPEVEDADDGKP